MTMKVICSALKNFPFFIPFMILLYCPCCAAGAQVVETNRRVRADEQDTLPAMNKKLADGKAVVVPMIFGEKFCDVNEKDGVVQIIIQLENKQYDFDISSSIFRDIGLLGASDKDIAAKVFL
jgi:hypothetical protein